MPTVQIQAWGTLYDQDQDPQADTATYGDPESDPGVSIQRARIGLIGETGGVDYELRFGPAIPYDALTMGSENIGVIDAIVGWSADAGPGALRLSVGTEKVPFSREELISSADLIFQERGVGTAWLTPGRELGVLADYALDSGLRLRAGAFNGNGSLLGDNNGGELGVLRLEWSRGDGYRTAVSESAVSVGLSALTEADVATSSSGLGADLLLRAWRFSLLVEANQLTLSPSNTEITVPDVFDPVVQRSALVQLSYLQEVKGGSVEPAVRLALLDDAKGRQDNGDVALLHAGLSWHTPREGLDLGAGWVHRQELQGRPLANDTARLWVQLVVPGPRHQPAGAKGAPHWSERFAGTWHSQGVLSGAVLTLWPDGELVDGNFRMTRPVGRVEVGRLYDLEALDQNDQGQILVKVDPHGDGTDVVWFELAPSDGGQLCGWGYEDGRRQDTVNSQGGGAWVCWTPE
ncbi:MAG: hypothetical protein JXX28_11920 [Deltaproteobacteria bacterium]|nr:hypothetical protein [Deltaproteobacteria bacterium]